MVAARSRACHPLPGRGRKVPMSRAKRQEGGDRPHHSTHVWAAGPTRKPKALRAGGPVKLRARDGGFGSWEADCVCARVCTQSCPALHHPKDCVACDREPTGLLPE